MVSAPNDCRICPKLDQISIKSNFGLHHFNYYKCTIGPGDGFLTVNSEDLAEIYEKCTLREQVVPKTRSLADELITEINAINGLYQFVFKTTKDLLKGDMQIARDLGKPCNAETLPLKIGSLARLFEIKLAPIQNKLQSCEPQWKSIRLLEEWLKQEGINYDPDIIETWRKIHAFRSKSHPYHRPDHKHIIEILNFFGEPEYPPNYAVICERILERFLDSLKKFKIILSQQNKQE